VNGVDDAGVDVAGGVTVVGFGAVGAPNEPVAAGAAAGTAPKVKGAGFASSAGFAVSFSAGFAVSAGFAAPKVNDGAEAAGFDGSAEAVDLGAPNTKGEDEVVVEVVPKGEGFASPSSFLAVSIEVGSFAAAPNPAKAGGFAAVEASSAFLGAVANPPPKLNVAGFAGSSFFDSSFFSFSFAGFVEAKKLSKPLFSPVAAGAATEGGAEAPKVNVGAVEATGFGAPSVATGAGAPKRGTGAFVGSADVFAAGGTSAHGVEPAKVNFAVDGFTSSLPILGPSGARK
jgi:hypothetical protein